MKRVISCADAVEAYSRFGTIVAAARELGVSRETIRYRLRESKGLCPRCGKHPPIEGLASCGACLEKNKQAQQRRAVGATLGGRRKSADHSLIVETYHKLDDNQLATARALHLHPSTIAKHINREKGLCICGRPLAKERKSCTECLETFRLRRHKQVQNAIRENTCIECNEPLADTSVRLCSRHLALANERSNRNRLLRKYGGNIPEALERDGYHCIICKGTEPRLDIHHKDGNRENNATDNLVTFCQHCHMALTMFCHLPNPHAFIDYLKEQGIFPYPPV